MNHRQGERVQMDFPITVYGPDRGPIPARLLDMSLSGAGVDCGACVGIEPMQRVELWMNIPEGRGVEPVKIAGFVVRRDTTRIGLAFMDEAPWLVLRLRDDPRPAGRRRPATMPPPMIAGFPFSDH
jgi:hypothetical protein